MDEPTYNGLRIELQLRTAEQHIWASAVETMSVILGQDLKFGQGDPDWIDLFALASCNIAHMEGTPPVDRFSHLDADGIRGMLSKLERKLNALDLMAGIVVAAGTSERTRGERREDSAVSLVTLDLQARSVDVRTFPGESLAEALAAYRSVEVEGAAGARLHAVLVTTAPTEKLAQAYPSYFLDIGDFARRLSRMVGA